MTNKSLRKLVAAAIVLVLVIACGAAIKARAATTKVTFYYKNCHDVSIYYALETQGDGDPKLVGNISKNGEAKRLKKDRAYIVACAGDNGYENSRVTFNLTDGRKAVRIESYYSSKKLEAMLQQNINEINRDFADTYNLAGLYEIQTGKLYHWGDWYGTTLLYKGNDNFNDDTLRLIMHKEGGAWKVKTRPPNITLSKFIYADVPVDILRAVNAQQR